MSDETVRDSGEALDFSAMMDFVEDYWGYRGTAPKFSSSEQSHSLRIYETFRVSHVIDPQTGAFFASVALVEDRLSSLLGKRLMLNNDEAGIAGVIDIIDEWCRLQLTDKFLAAYDEAYKPVSH